MNHMTDCIMGDEPWNEKDVPVIECPRCEGEGCRYCDYTVYIPLEPDFD